MTCACSRLARYELEDESHWKDEPVLEYTQLLTVPDKVRQMPEKSFRRRGLNITCACMYSRQDLSPDRHTRAVGRARISTGMRLRACARDSTVYIHVPSCMNVIV